MDGHRKTRIHWNASNSRLLNGVSRSRWHEVRLGLKIVLAAEAFLLALAAPGLVVWWTARCKGPLPWTTGLEGNEDAELLGLIAAIGGFLLSYLLLLIGHWRFLACAPQGDSAREVMFVGLVTTLISAVLNLTAVYLGGAADHRDLERVLESLDQGLVPPLASLLQVAGVTLFLLPFLLICQLVRIIATRFKDSGQVRSVDWFILYGCLLLGAVVGVCIILRRRTVPSEVVLGLVAAWGVCLVWHVALLIGASLRLSQVLHPIGVDGPGVRSKVDDSPPRSSSGFHCFLKTPIS
jgi:hypothetical protein